MGRCVILLMVLFAALVPRTGLAETRVRIVETWPAAQEVRLGPRQPFYLRLAYESDRPVGLWLHAYHQGRQVSVGSSPSRRHQGAGEAMAWFFFTEPVGVVDEIRIVAGDGSRDDTTVVATWRGRVSASTRPANGSGGAEPAWLQALREQERQAQQRDRQAAMDSADDGDDWWVLPVVWGMMALGIVGLVVPVVAICKWKGGWRVAAMVPAALVGFVILRIVVDTTIDPTSHNLWPFELAMVGGLSSALMLLFVVVRWLMGAGRRR